MIIPDMNCTSAAEWGRAVSAGATVAGGAGARDAPQPRAAAPNRPARIVVVVVRVIRLQASVTPAPIVGDREGDGKSLPIRHHFDATDPVAFQDPLRHRLSPVDPAEDRVLVVEQRVVDQVDEPLAVAGVAATG